MNQQRASSWSVTINNPTATDEENLALARQKGWKVEGQLEKGDNGTPHYQLLVKTPQIRFSAIKKQFPRAHIEVARNVEALEQYVHKEDTKVGELATTTELYPSLQKTWDMFYDYVQDQCSNKKRSLWADWNSDDWLHNFDKFIRCYIEKGYVLETMGVNPQIRSAVKLYGNSMFIRSGQRRGKNQETTPIDRQTDRQTDENNVEVNDIQDEESGSKTSQREVLQQETSDEEGNG